MEEPDPRPGPSDRSLDRRSFLRRMAALTGSAMAGATVRPPSVGSATDAPPASREGLPPFSGSRQVDPSELTIAEASSLIRDGELSPVELVEAFLERIRSLDDLYLAFNTVPAEAALSRARALAEEPWRGPFHGIPLALKDNYYTAGVLTSANSYLYQDFIPDRDATAWARLRSAGAILLGKTQMGPLATSRATTPDGANTTVHAWTPGDPSVSPGGSSSGSATAVAARMAAGATGTQTGGSITIPAGVQGLTGLKPTLGRVSLHGIIPLTYTRDHPGPLARDALDAALMLQAMAGPDERDVRTLGIPPPSDYVTAATPVRRDGRPALRWPTRVGVLPEFFAVLDPEEARGDGEVGDTRDERLDPETVRRRRIRAERTSTARRALLATLEDLGARVVELDPPPDWEVLTGSEFNDVRLPERSEAFLEELRDDVRSFGVSLAPWINGLLLPGAEYLRGQRARMTLLRRILDHLFAGCDVVMQTRPHPFDMVGLPLVSFPIGFEEASGDAPRPLSATMGALPYAEDRLLSVVTAFQAATDFHRRRPPEPDRASGAGGVSPERARPPWGSPREVGPEDGGADSLGRGRTGLEAVIRTGE